MRSIRSLVLVPALMLAASGTFAADEGKKDEKAAPHPYTLNVSAVDGKPLGDKPVVFVYKNHEIKVVDEAEKAAFEKNADANLKKVEEAEKAEKKADKAAEKAEKKADEKK